jgi:hypothetical protein
MKWRLFLAACCNRIAPLLNQRAQRLIEFANSFVDKIIREETVEQVFRWYSRRSGIQATRLMSGLCSPLAIAAGELRTIAGHYAFRLALTKSAPNWEQRAISAMRAAIDAEGAAQSELIRRIIGNPFR